MKVYGLKCPVLIILPVICHVCYVGYFVRLATTGIQNQMNQLQLLRAFFNKTLNFTKCMTVVT